MRLLQKKCVSKLIKFDHDIIDLTYHLFYLNGESRQLMRNEATNHVMQCDDINYKEPGITCNGIGGPGA